MEPAIDIGGVDGDVERIWLGVKTLGQENGRE